MLLRFFRINDPYRLLGLLVLLILISLIFFIDRPPLTISDLKGFLVGEAVGKGQQMYTQVIDSTAPLMAGLFGAADWIFGRSVPARQIIALLLIFFQASYFAILLINNKAYNDSTYLPALIFAILCFFSFDLFSFSPELIGSSVLLLALNYLFKEIEFRSERDEIILNLGVCLGVAALIIFSYSIFFLITIVILLIFTRPSIRKVLLLIFGFLLPHVLVVTLYYFRGELGTLWYTFYEANLTAHGFVWMTPGGLFILSIIPLTYFVFSIFMLNREARFTKYQSQLFQVMFFWMAAGVVQILVTRDLSPRSLIIFIPSLSYFISYYLLLIRRKWIGDTMLSLFIIGILGMNVMARYGRLSAIGYERMIPKVSVYDKEIRDKKVLLTSDDIGIYRNNELAGYFLDYGLSKSVLEHPEYYENIILMYNSFKAYPPDIIVDPQHLMKGYFERIPELGLNYVQQGDLYRRKSEKKP